VCGRTTSTIPRDTLARVLEVDEVEAPELPISWNLAPTQPVYAVAVSSGGARRLRALRWGLVPSWAKGPRAGSRMINARAETLADKPAFRPLLGARRALVAVSGFYEWRRPRPGEAPGSQPFYFYPADGGPLVLAGLWDLWRDAGGAALRTCTIITTTANATMAPVHHRMPVVVGRDDWQEWLRPEPLRPARLAELLAPAPEALLHAYPVTTAVNKATNDGPQLLERQLVGARLPEKGA
jgi:putative SOS response-associated peptidase YedK